MEGVSIRWDREVMLTGPNSVRTDLFRPMKRALTDLTSSGKRKEKSEARPEKGNQVPVVSVQYDVPKQQNSPMMMFRYRKAHTQVALQNSQRAKSETKLMTELPIKAAELPIRVPEFPLKLSARIDRRIKEQKAEQRMLRSADQLAGAVDSHRLKGLAVGKFYSEYQPPPTAPDGGSRPATITPFSRPGHRLPSQELSSYTSTDQSVGSVTGQSSHKSSCQENSSAKNSASLIESTNVSQKPDVYAKDLNPWKSSKSNMTYRLFQDTIGDSQSHDPKSNFSQVQQQKLKAQSQDARMERAQSLRSKSRSTYYPSPMAHSLDHELDDYKGHGHSNLERASKSYEKFEYNKREKNQKSKLLEQKETSPHKLR